MGRRKPNASDGSGGDDEGAVSAAMTDLSISVPHDELYHSLLSHNAYFDSLVDMLPAKMYATAHPTGDELYNPKYRRGQHKESKESRRARNKAERRDKFHPDRAETTLERKRRLDNEEDDDDEDDDDGDEGGMDEAIVDAHEEELEEGGGAAGASSSAPLPSSANASRIESLRARLRAKIAERRASRPNGGGEDDSVGISKRSARRAEKRKRAEEAKRRRSQLGKSGGKTEAEKGRGRTEFKMGGANAAARSPSLTEDLAGVGFGSLAGLDAKPTYLDNKSLSGAGKKKSLDRLLAEAEKKAEKLKRLKASRDEDDRARADKMEWGDALREATGTRVRDDPSLIKKAMKRKAKKKERSAKAWKDRTKATREKMDERQRIRGHNLGQRKLGGMAGANLSRKRIKDDDDAGAGGTSGASKDEKKKRPRLGPHSGKGRAGFEGRKSDFINGNKGGKGEEKAAAQ